MTSKSQRTGRRPHRFAGMSKEGRRSARRRVFIEAGTDAIAEFGVAELKVRAICETAELTERYFYESFENLQQFAFEVVLDVSHRVSARLLSEAIQITDGHARLRAVSKTLVSIIDEDPRVGRILFVEAERAGGALAKLRHQLLYTTTWLMTKWLTEEQSTSDLSTFAAMMIAQTPDNTVADAAFVGDIDTIALAGAASEILIAWVDHQVDMTAEELVDYLLRYIDRAVAWQQDK